MVVEMKGSLWGSFRASRWSVLLWVVPAIIVLAIGVVFTARWLREIPGVVEWIASYPGRAPLPDWAPIGIPAWLGWQHFLSAFFLVMIVRSGWLVRTTKRPPASWIRSNRGIIRTKQPPRKISVHLWLHNAVDLLWVVNGVVFVVLLFATGQWVRIVPTSWGVVPNALSAALQYASFDWPSTNGWVDYNALQQLSYFGVVFILSPLAIVTGLRMAEFWPTEAKLSSIYKIEWARAAHFPVMLIFVLFTFVHVLLVFTTGAQQNLNHMFAASDNAASWWGVVFLAGALTLMAAAVAATTPILIRPIAALFGKVSR
jgi:thiosulfate reductase cytochrome b subunit